MALSNKALQNILRMILKSEHYRQAVIDQITDDFFEFTVQYFKDIASAKFKGKEIGRDWYKKYFLDGRFSLKDTAIYAGLNDKTIRNIYGSSAKKVVVDVTPSYYDELMDKVESLVSDNYSDLEVDLRINYQNASIKLTLSETLIVVNTFRCKAVGNQRQRPERSGQKTGTAAHAHLGKAVSGAIQVLCRQRLERRRPRRGLSFYQSIPKSLSL